ncbi:MAG: preprotein translocase subunit SecA [Planctomycetaceae bacterium]|nr:preprotein translocase subunit SecA [Planctomycetaceae bacterium]
MEFLEKIGDFFIAITAAVERLVTRLFGASNERMMKRLGFDRKGHKTTITPGTLLDKINRQKDDWQKLSDDELRESAAKFRARLAQGETLDDLLPDVFAAARESGRRHLRMSHYDVQMIGGYVLHKGMIAEMVTGEGKTLVATLAATLNALSGHVHVITVNDYLARRDMEWMGPLYMGLGLTVGCIQSHQEGEEKAQAYQCDITYGTNNEFGFDYLRDHMKPAKELQVQGPLTYAIIDEIDNILIDEARTPLIISGPAHDDVDKYRKADRVAKQLKKDVHFEVKEKEHTCHLTDDGVRAAEEIANQQNYVEGSFYTAGNMEWPHLIDNALKAHHLYKRDVNYVSMEGEIIIVDEFTGRLMKGRQWSDGLHQAVEAKEGVTVKAENQTLATITLQNFFKLYKKLAGMTGTAMTEANEFWKIYKLDVVACPTNQPLSRFNYADVIYRSEGEKFKAVVEEIRQFHESGRPILVGTVSIETSERVSGMLEKFGIKHEVLNAKHHEREADIIAQAGRKSAVTIATNMAGRGTDIILGGNPDQAAWEQLKHTYTSRLEIPKAEWDALTRKIATDEGMVEEGRNVAELGGLHVVGTERHEARRIDLQLRGRSGRQGDPGSSRFFLSLEDELMRKFAGDWVKNVLTRLGMQEGEAIESGLVSRQIERAQKRVEEHHFEQRKNLLEYDEVMDQQRKRVYSFRQNILEGGDCRTIIFEMLKQQIEQRVAEVLAPDYGRATCAQWAAQQAGIEIEPADLRENEPELVIGFLKDEAVSQAEDLIRDKIDEDLPSDIEDQSEWNWLGLSKWANARWGLNTNDRELKKIGRDGMFESLFERAKEAIERAEFTPVNDFLAEDYGRRSLVSGLAHQYTLTTLKPEQFEGLSKDEAVALIFGEVDRLYKEKEIHFPVAVGMSRFMAESGGGGDRYDRDGLARWVNSRFQTQLDPEALRGKSRADIQGLITQCSQQFYSSGSNGQVLEKVESYLDQAYGLRNGEETRLAPVRQSEPLKELVAWAQQEFKSSLEVDELLPLPRDQTRQKLVSEYEARYRPELRQAERSLLLEVLDTAWKDHLYFMDHLRQGIGLVGYAQKDPKVEYKREGMKAFEGMWKGIAQQVTGSIFRMEQESPGFVGSLWQITSTTHEELGPDFEEGSVGVDSGSDRPKGNAPNSAAAEKPIEPIRNRGERVGRNETCPCGSGKKFKNCHGKR